MSPSPPFICLENMHVFLAEYFGKILYFMEPWGELGKMEGRKRVVKF